MAVEGERYSGRGVRDTSEYNRGNKAICRGKQGEKAKSSEGRRTAHRALGEQFHPAVGTCVCVWRGANFWTLTRLIPGPPTTGRPVIEWSPRRP